MLAATLDANVLVSGIIGYLRDSSTPGMILRNLEAETFHLVISRHILDEVNRTLKRPDFRPRLADTRVTEAHRALNRRAGNVVRITVTVHGVATHPEDDLVLATALSGNADYLVTGDKGLISVESYRGVTIVTRRTFLDILDSDSITTSTT